MAIEVKIDLVGRAEGWFDETATSSGWFDPDLADTSPPAADEQPGAAWMSTDVVAETWASHEHYADDIQGTQLAPLHDFELPPDESVLNTSVPDYLVDELFEPGEFWFQTGPPTSLDDETGQTRGQTCLPDYLEPDDQIDPSDADWQNPTTLNDAVCTFPMYKAQARTAPASGTTHTATLPAYAAGDGVLLLVATSTAPVLTTPSGWGAVFHTSSTALTLNTTIAAYWRVMDGTEGATVDVTSSTTITLTFQAFSFTQIDPYTGPDSATDVTATADDDPPSLTHDWPSQKVMWVAADLGADDTHTVSTAPTNYQTWGLFGFPTGGANQYVMAGLRQLDAATTNPDVFFGNIGSSATATIAIRGLCLDGLNDDPAGQSVPVDMELEPEPLQDGWQQSVTVEDFPLDPDILRTAIPDDLEPEAEVDSDGWRCAPLDDAAADADVTGTSVPNDLEPEVEPLQDGWQNTTTALDATCTFPSLRGSASSAANLTNGDFAGRSVPDEIELEPELFEDSARRGSTTYTVDGS